MSKNRKFLSKLARRKHYTPAAWCILQFQGVRPLARAIGRDPSTVQRWPLPAAAKGRDGRVPDDYHVTILEQAKARELDITPDDLIHGRRAA